MKYSYKKVIIAFIFIFSICALVACATNNSAVSDGKTSISDYLDKDDNTTDASINNTANTNKTAVAIIPDSYVTDDIEYDVYKKIDLSEFIRNDGNGTFIDHKDGGIYLSETPCKVTIKASVKIDKGPALPDDDINDALAVTCALGPIYADMYYADYGDDFFGTFHEIERAEEYFTSINGKIYFSNLGVNGLRGSSGWKENYVSHNDTEYIGEVLNQDKTSTKVRVTIKDIYYKISKPTGTVSDWDLNQDFTLSNFYGTQGFVMRELDMDYNYIIKPKFTFDVNPSYNQNKSKYLSFYYTSSDNNPEFCASIMSERAHDITPRYNKVGVGFPDTYFNISSVSGNNEFDLSWDKNTKTITANDKSGNNLVTIKLDYIKEYKYKKCPENETPGYARYLIATNQNDTKENIRKDIEKKDEAAAAIALSNTTWKIEEEELRKFENHSEKKVLNFEDHIINYDLEGYTCKRIPNFVDVEAKSVNNSFNEFFGEFFNFVEKEKIDLDCKTYVPNYKSADRIYDKNNIMLFKFSDYILKPKIYIEVYIDLNELRYSFSGYWNYGQDATDYNKNTKNHGVINRSVVRSLSESQHIFNWHSLGYEPINTDWWYKPIENIVSIEDANIGDYIHFGKYWTVFADDYQLRYMNKDAKQDLEWQVLDKVDDKLLITTRHAIDSRNANIGTKIFTWENCTLRAWLNNDFLGYAFNTNDQKRIVDGADKIFLLSEEEARKYFSNDSERQCKASYFARSCLCWYSINQGMCGNCYYWLRTPGNSTNKEWSSLMCVNPYGEINTIGETIYSDIGVRPAMWIKIN